MTLCCYYWNIFSFVVLLLTFPFWPAPVALEYVAIIFIVIIVSYRWLPLKWTRGVMWAMLLVSLHSYLFQLRVENAFHAGTDITTNVRVDSFFKQLNQGKEYLLRFESINGQKIPYLFQPRVMTVVSDELPLRLGEHWRLKLRLKAVYGRANEVGYDRERFYLSQNLHARARVADIFSATLIEPSQSWRWYLYRSVVKAIADTEHRDLLLALSFADRNGLTQERWQALKASGLIHLVAISGLHIGMAFAVGWYLGCGVRLLSPRWLGAPVITALSMAVSYAWLAGFSLPTQRAVLMCAVLSVLFYFRLRYQFGTIFISAMALILALDPFAILGKSFWLSFGAVGVLSLLSAQKNLLQNSRVKTLLFTQFWITFLMLPASVLFFSGVSISSWLYNLLFVPWFSFIVVPLIFLALLVSVFFSNHAELFWCIADIALKPVVLAIQYAGPSWIEIPVYIGGGVLLVLFLLLIRPLLGQLFFCYAFVALMLLSYILFYSAREEADDEWSLSMLDVGHGLAVLIEKKGKYLLYDTGNRWPGGSIAEQVIAPILKMNKIGKLDGLILSHLDLDHAGGRHYLEQNFPPKTMWSSQKLVGYQPCIQGTVIHWQGLLLEGVWPPRLVDRAYNPHSCVIRISDGKNRVLLTGDLEAIGEFSLVNHSKVSADILTVPHHGSKSSSTERFIDAVSPSLAIASLAKGNQWSLPNTEVLERYWARGITWLDTGEQGQITIRFYRTGWQIITERSRQSLTWYRQILRKGVE